MAAVPVIINGMLYPKEKGSGGISQATPVVVCGYLSLEGLSVGGGPILPDGTPPVDPPVEPPTNPPPNVAVVVKPAPVTGGWGIATDQSGSFQWFFTPGPTSPGPKR